MSRTSHIAFDLQLADLDMESGDREAALERLDQWHSNFPGNHVIAVHYSRALLQNNAPGDAEKAADILKDQLRSHDSDPALFELYARSANLKGD